MTTSSTPVRPGRLLRAVTIATAVTAAIVFAGSTGTTGGVALTSADPIDIAQGVSISPAPGWTRGNRGPDWVRQDSRARFQSSARSASCSTRRTSCRPSLHFRQNNNATPQAAGDGGTMIDSML